MDAARHWARGGKSPKDDRRPDEEVVRDMRAGGAPEGLIEKYQAAADTPPEKFAVPHESADDLALFVHMDTQWRWAAAGQFMSSTGAAAGQIESHRVGLDYNALPATARMLGIKVGRERFQLLRSMELAALDELTKIAKERRA
jgi:hypothetical protein